MLRPIVLAGAVLALATPSAFAGDVYVSKAGDDADLCFESSPCKTVQTAVLRAAVGDTVHIGPGVYEESVAVDKRVKLVGKSAGGSIFNPQFHTKIAAPGRYPAIEMTNGGEVRNLRATGGEGPVQAPAIALEAHAGSTPVYEVAGVYAVGGLDSTSDHEGTPALGARGVDGGRMNLTITTSAFHQADEPYTREPVLDIEDAGTVAVRQSSITPDARDAPPPVMSGGPAISARGATTLTVDAVQVGGATGGGLWLRGGTTATVNRSRFHAAGTALYVDGQDATTRATVRDSLFLAHGEGTNRTAASIGAAGTGRADVELVRSTVVVSAPTPYAALNVASAGAATADVRLLGTVLRANGNTVEPDVFAHEAPTSTTTVTQSRSAYTTVHEEGDPQVAVASVTGNPLFVNVGGLDVRPMPQSPLVDAGYDEPGATDLSGTTRGTDSNGDCTARSEIGAYELAAVAPTDPCPEPQPQQDPGTPPGAGASEEPPAPPAQPAVATAPSTAPTQVPAVQRAAPGDRLAPALKGLKLSGGKAKFTLGEAAKVTATIERRAGKRWTRVKRTTTPLGAGKRSVTLPKLVRGAYRLKLQAVDAAGNQTSRTLGFVRR